MFWPEISVLEVVDLNDPGLKESKPVGLSPLWVTLALSLCTRFSNFGFWSLFQIWKKSSSKPTRFFFEFELDFYCLCSLQKSISKSN